MPCTILHCTGPYCTALHCTALYWTVLHCSTYQCNTYQSMQSTGKFRAEFGNFNKSYLPYIAFVELMGGQQGGPEQHNTLFSAQHRKQLPSSQLECHTHAYTWHSDCTSLWKWGYLVYSWRSCTCDHLKTFQIFLMRIDLMFECWDLVRIEALTPWHISAVVLYRYSIVQYSRGVKSLDVTNIVKIRQANKWFM